MLLQLQDVQERDEGSGPFIQGEESPRLLLQGKRVVEVQTRPERTVLMVEEQLGQDLEEHGQVHMDRPSPPSVLL